MKSVMFFLFKSSFAQFPVLVCVVAADHSVFGDTKTEADSYGSRVRFCERNGDVYKLYYCKTAHRAAEIYS